MLISTLLPISAHQGQRLADVATAPVSAWLQHVLLGPALEELLFRGLLLQLACRVVPARTAVLLSATGFGALHIAVGPSVLLLATLVGVLLGWLALSRRSVYPSFLCHVAFNFTSGFVLIPLFGVGSKVAAAAQMPAHPPGMFDIVPAWWVAASSALAMTALVLLMRESHSRRATTGT